MIQMKKQRRNISLIWYLILITCMLGSIKTAFRIKKEIINKINACFIYSAVLVIENSCWWHLSPQNIAVFFSFYRNFVKVNIVSFADSVSFTDRNFSYLGALSCTKDIRSKSIQYIVVSDVKRLTSNELYEYMGQNYFKGVTEFFTPNFKTNFIKQLP